ncbi:hypothetical protein [Methylocystis sp. S23]
MSAYERYKSALGKPNSPAIHSPRTTQIWSDHAIIFWVQNPGRLCALATEDRPAGNNICKNDPGEARFHDIDLTRKEFNVKKDEYPPFGGIYTAIKSDQKHWKWVLPLRAVCEIENDSVYFQSFEEGEIYGPFPETRKSNNSSFFLIFTQAGGINFVYTNMTPPQIKGCRLP